MFAPVTDLSTFLEESLHHELLIIRKLTMLLLIQLNWTFLRALQNHRVLK